MTTHEGLPRRPRRTRRQKDTLARVRILEEYSGLVDAKRRELCDHCLSRESPSYFNAAPSCHFNLLPVTSTGLDCPYWQQRPEQIEGGAPHDP